MKKKNKCWVGFLLFASIAVAGADETSVTTVKEVTSSRNAFQIGLTAGSSVNPDAGPLGLGLSYGARVEYKPTSMLGVGLFATHTEFANANYIIASQSLRQTLLGAEVKLYPFSNDGFYLGGKVGASLLSSEISAWDQTVASASHTDLVVGASAGYNFKLGQNFSLGPEVSYLKPASSEDPYQVLTVLNLNLWM